jgi:hypothetical protein
MTVGLKWALELALFRLVRERLYDEPQDRGDNDQRTSRPIMEV